MKIEHTARGLRVWSAYRDFMRQKNVMRRGERECGFYKDNRVLETQDINFDRPLSDLGHSAGIAQLFLQIAINYPEVIPMENYWRHAFYAMLHDQGEFEAGGDKAADGRRDEKAMNELEAGFIDRILARDYPPEYRKLGNQLYWNAANLSDIEGEINHLGDKTEAVTYCFVLEKELKQGDVRYKQWNFGANPKECGDILAMEYTHTMVPADNWLCNTLKEPGILNCKHLNVFLEIIQSAAFDVRKKEMLWLDDFLENYPKEVKK